MSGFDCSNPSGPNLSCGLLEPGGVIPSIQKVREDSDTSLERVERCAATISRTVGQTPTLAFVLGSGFQPLISRVEIEGELPYSKLPGFPRLTVAGHVARLIWGRLGPVKALFCCGRAHFYEGHAMETITFPVRVLARCGVTDLILSNAAGAINKKFRPGEFMVLTDHINFTGVNPLRGLSDGSTSRFVDLTETYSRRLNQFFRKAARRADVTAHRGTYIGVSGPSYETPAEIRAFAKMGADAVGMSTIPEAIIARYCGMEVAALSCLTNRAAGLSGERLSHDHVLQAAEHNAAAAGNLLLAFAQEYAGSHPKTGLKTERKRLKKI